MNIALVCASCEIGFLLPKYRYKSRIKRNPNCKFYCSYRCVFPIHTEDPTKKYCPSCKNVKLRSEFYGNEGRHDNITIYCISCHNIKNKETATKYPLRQSNIHKKRRWNRKIALFTLLGQTKCVYCEFSIYPALQFEHKNGNGSKDRLRFKNLDDFYKYYLEHSEEAKKELQITCANCNWIKRFSREEQLTYNKRILQLK